MTILENRILGLPRFDRCLRKMAIAATTNDFPLDASGSDLSPADWNYALICASALTPIDSEASQDAVLRVAQACLRSPGASPDQKAASLLLLSRIGNEEAIRLALHRELVQAVPSDGYAPDLLLDAARRRQELTITLASGEQTTVNTFQRAFWSAIHQNRWVSVSAPTSAGKSYIVRQWIVEQLKGADHLRVVYLAPTRALVEEVSDTLRAALPNTIGVHTLPWDPTISNFRTQIYVMTQERLHLLLHRLPQLAADIAFVDEAQKIAEGTRGILLSQVVDEMIVRNSEIKLVFASPLSANPEVLLGASTDQKASLVGETVTVNQSLIFAKQVYRQRNEYSLKLVYRGSEADLGAVRLAQVPDTPGEKTPFLAAALGMESGGNLVYANGPAEAEKYARRIYDYLGPDADSDDPLLDELIDFARGVVHDRFSLATVARRGIAFHYGDMPLVLKAKVESLFRKGAIRFLVCTSTLLEGVNLPCRNIFMRAPRKGREHMTAADFWNLAGRAGRWGKEFQGNIVCIDADDPAAWPERPGLRQRSTISPVAAQIFGAPADLVAYIAAGGPKASSEGSAELESAFSWVSGRALHGDGTVGIYGAASADPESLAGLGLKVHDALDGLDVDPGLVMKHAGISPLSIQRLYEAIIEHGRPDLLALVPPASDEAFAEYKTALDYVAEYLGGSFQNELRRLSLARLIVHWMRGVPLSVIIDNRAYYLRTTGQAVVYPKLIRKVMEDVEDIARFEAPKFLSCYADVVRAAAARLGVTGYQETLDIDMMLELGVPSVSGMSLIAIGLSRATAMAVVVFLPSRDMSPDECSSWLLGASAEDLDVPRFAVREVQEVQSVLRARLGITG